MKILVPTDFSELSEKALAVANKFAKLMGGTVTPFHSHIPISELDEPYALGMSSQMYQDFEEIENSLTDRLKQLAEEHVDKGILKKPIVMMGNPAQSIVDTSEEFDYIVMSTHGRTGFSRFLLGSVAEKVLRLAHTPVLIVENESEVDDFKKILVTTDFSDNAASAYPYARQIAEKSGADLDLVHVVSFDQFEEEDEESISISDIREKRIKLVEKEYFHSLKGEVNSMVIISQDSPHEAIFNHVNDNEYNLIVMATVGRTGINYLMMGSTTANLVRHVKTAVLSINPKRDKK
ncbi:universal stress protein [Rhodohalobacter halophilus]|uniref:universal stress protein n=1 Tax=Rhodohalobacter halophilus TaxID=1812810 RepID=UPI00083FA799|nr:universal stress protein [Rhodohalobacter halophilus]